MFKTKTFNYASAYGYVYGPDTVPLRFGQPLDVYEWDAALLFRHGALVETLRGGRHRRFGRGYAVRLVDMRPWVLPVPTQEVPTADGTTVKVTLSALVRVGDAATFVTASRSATDRLYLALQLALRTVVATVGVEELLAARADLVRRIGGEVGDVSDVGLVVERVEVKDVILPSELKRAQAEVLVARAQGLAALERARGETAALRGLANAARMAADNPALL